jgi:uncharacterized Ntn-hydrolase superfamily protein
VTYTVAVVDTARQELALGTISHSSSAFTKVFSAATGTSRTALVASQAFSSKELGEACADLASAGEPHGSLDAACRAATWAAFRQVLAVTTDGLSFGYTGARCVPWAGHRVDEATGVAVAGNMLLDGDVLSAAALAAAEAGRGADERVLAGLAAGGAAGGDFRGDRAGGLRYDGPGGTYDVRVDDHGEPHAELERLSALERGRRALATCFAWIAEGQPAAGVDVVLAALDPGVPHDTDLAAWHLAVRLLSGRAESQDPGTSPAVAEVAHRLVERVARAGATS